jgi:hypothetical protein
MLQVSEAELKSVTDSNYANLFGKAGKKGLDSVYYEEYEKVGWIGTYPEAFTSTPSTKYDTTEGTEIDIITYTTSTRCSFLVASTMEYQFPEIELKEEYKDQYRFKLIDDVGYKSPINATFGSTDTPVQSLDPHSQIMLHEKMTDAGHKKSLERKMGLKTVCKKWTTHMPTTVLYYRQQWYYSFWPCKAFPMYLLSQPGDIRHVYNMILDLQRLINVKKLNKETLEWELVKTVDTSIFSKFPKKIPPPILYGRFSHMSPEEYQERLNIKLDNFYILDMIRCDAENERKPGQEVTASLRTFGGVVQALFWAADNVTYKSSNITCNYTIDELPNKYSQSGIKYNTLNTESGPKFTKIPTALLEGELAVGTFTNSGNKNGILAWQYVEKLTQQNNGGSCPQHMATSITCTINSSVSKQSRFFLIFRALVSKKMTIKDGKLNIEHK